MTRHSNDRRLSGPDFSSFTLLMVAVLGIWLLAACVTASDPEPSADLVRVHRLPTSGERSDPSSAASGASADHGDAWDGVQEMVVTGSRTSALMDAGTSTVSFAASDLGAVAVSSVAYFMPSLDLTAGAEGAYGDQYHAVDESGFVRPVDVPRSTFSIDVDTASYANVRRFLASSQAPPAGAVRIEEMINYFRYPARVVAERDDPFGVDLELFEAPWNHEHRLLRVSVEGRRIDSSSIPPRNLVFLLDVSGSMSGPDRLPLVQYGLSRLTETLRAEDRVSIVVYAGASGLVLPATAGNEKSTILTAIDRLEAGGATAGAEGIELAYQTARATFLPGGINRVILATDGDFNVGVSSHVELVRMIEEQRKTGVELTVLGVGRGNLNDATMEQLADHGDGNYAYLDRRSEARRVLVTQAAGTLVTIAKDVKIQVEFNPRRVAAYRLIGYENRRMADQDFADDTKDAGEIGAGHHVTALYEIIPVGAASPVRLPGVPPLRYQSSPELSEAENASEWLTVALRYKRPGASEPEGSRFVEKAFAGEASSLRAASESARFASAVALFGMLLQGSDFAGDGSFAVVEDLARTAMGSDEYGEREEFLRWVEVAGNLK